jgi:o-succinylbenzoate synthase
MSELTWSTVPYKRSLLCPITTSHGVYAERAGFLLCVRNRDDLYGLGDVAPLPGFSPETLDDARRQWDAIHDWVTQLDLPKDAEALGRISRDLHQVHRCCQSLQFGIETSLADLAARDAGVPLAHWLNADAETEVEVNAVLHAQDADQLREQAIEKTKAGYRTFKLKAGSASVADDVKRIKAVRGPAPDANIRIDANAAWNASRFREMCLQIAHLSLEFVEQPLRVGEAATAHQISGEFGIRLALDEEAESMEDAVRLIEQRLCDVLVLKPMMVGGLTGCLRLAAIAERFGIGVVFTSAWESDVGLAATLHLAAACRAVSCASGLSTAGMIAEGLVQPALSIKHARLRVPSQPGLGLKLV